MASIEPRLPKHQPGTRRVDDRRVISGIIHILTTGCDCPAEHGPPIAVYNRFHRWSRRRFRNSLLEALAGAGAVTKSAAMASTYVKAQRSTFGGKGAGTTDRPLAGQPNEQDPRAHRCDRPAVCPHADALQRLGHEGGGGIARPPAWHRVRHCRQGIQRGRSAPLAVSVHQRHARAGRQSARITGLSCRDAN